MSITLPPAPSKKLLASKPLWLPREMISRGWEGARQLAETLPNSSYTQDVVFILFHGNANAAYAVMDRIVKQEKQYSPALRRAIDRWFELNGDDFYRLIKADRNAATHNFELAEVHYYSGLGYREDGTYGEMIAHYFKQVDMHGFEGNVTFAQWSIELWTWWIGRLNQLHRMYQAELKASGEAK